MSNVYYDPEKFGLAIVAEVEPPGLNYEFDQVVVWRDSHGALYGAHDSGCSCPVPFEDVGYPADMTPIRALADLDALLGEFSDYYQPTASDLQSFKAKVRAALIPDGHDAG